jgi:AraC-like DNA-binding protein
MEKKLKDTAAEVVLTCLEERYLKNEIMLNHHCFVRIISGEIKIISADRSVEYGPGDTILFPRRELSTVIQYPKGGEPYKCVLIILKNDRLKDYFARNPVITSTLHRSAVHSYGPHPLLNSYFSSLIAYFDLQDTLLEKLLAIKIDEALTILRTIDSNVDALLTNFSEPGKIDLADFMEKNYKFNMPLDRFSYLTGRSLTTFKRDFKNIYGVTPQRWLTEKRLKLAYYLLSEGNHKPAEIYREAGFENLSHFSFAF